MQKPVLSLALLVAAAPAFAAPYDGPLVVKTNGSGYVSPEYWQSEKCEVFLDKVVITKQFGIDEGFMATETRQLTLTDSIRTTITKAAAAQLTSKDNGLCDAPSTSVVAYKADASGNAKAVELFSTGGCGSPRLERQGGAAWALRKLVDSYCPTTHDYSGAN